jgi:hypothetical protein
MKRFVFITLLFFSFSYSFAQIPRTISYQGVLTGTDGSPVKDGMVSLTFRLYNVSNGGDTLWQETQDVMVSKGIFNVILGSKTSLNLPFDEQYWLGVSVESGEELNPRTALTASPYSLNSYSTIAETKPGQGLIIRNSSGETTHQLNTDGSAMHTGESVFWGGITSGDTATALDTLSNPLLDTTINKKGGFKMSIITGQASIPKIGFKSKGTQVGVYGEGGDYGIWGFSKQKWGVFGESITGKGVVGVTSGNGSYGVEGYSPQNFGIYGHSHFSVGIVGKTLSSTLPAIWSQGKLKIDDVPAAPNQDRFLVWDTDHIVKYRTTSSLAFDGILQDKPFLVKIGSTEVFKVDTSVSVNGDVNVNGTLVASVIQAETKQFRIDDPLDPEHKYLNHTSVESSEMKNVYDGEVVLDRNGEAVVSLPDWFQALNIDYRYQLTCIGGYAPVYIKEEIHNNRFKIAGGQEGLKICWLVTGVRNDKFAREHRMKVITNK